VSPGLLFDRPAICDRARHPTGATVCRRACCGRLLPDLV